MKIKWLLVAVACATCLEWTRLSGVVKGVNLKDSTVTIQNREGDFLTVPIDYQVSMIAKSGEARTIKTVKLDDKITLTRIQAEKPREDSEGLVPFQNLPHEQ